MLHVAQAERVGKAEVLRYFRLTRGLRTQRNGLTLKNRAMSITSHIELCRI